MLQGVFAAPTELCVLSGPSVTTNGSIHLPPHLHALPLPIPVSFPVSFLFLFQENAPGHDESGPSRCRHLFTLVNVKGKCVNEGEMFK